MCEIVVQLRFIDRSQGSPTGLDASVHWLRFHLAEHRRFDSAVRKIEARTVIVAGNGAPVTSATPVAVLDLCRRKLHGVRIAMRRQAVDYRPSRISEAQQLGNFVECLTSGVVTGVADVLV